MKRRFWLSAVASLLSFAALSPSFADDKPVLKASLTVTAVSESTVRVTASKEDLKRFIRNWQTSVWPGWETELNAKGTNLAIEQMKAADRDIDAGQTLLLYNGMPIYRKALGEAIALHSK